MVMMILVVMMVSFLFLDKTNKREFQHSLTTEETNPDDSCVETPWSIIVSSPLWMKDFTVLDLYSSSDSLILWLESSNTRETCDNHGVLCCWIDWRREYLINV
jgi:hypothetical protein